MEEGYLGRSSAYDSKRDSKSAHPLYRCHSIEAATTAKGVGGPLGRPLRSLGLDGFFESPTIVTFSTENKHVSMRAMSLRAQQVGDREMGIGDGREGWTNSTGFLRLRTRPSREHSRPSTSADGVCSATPDSMSCGPTWGEPRGKASLKRERNMTMNCGTWD